MMVTHMLIEHDRPAQIVHVGEHYDWGFDARPGDTVIVIMDPVGAPVERCLDMGGEPVVNPFTTITECDGVDF